MVCRERFVLLQLFREHVLRGAGALVLSGNMCRAGALFGEKAKPQIPLSQQAQAEKQRPGPLGHRCLSHLGGLPLPLSLISGAPSPQSCCHTPPTPTSRGAGRHSLGRGLVSGWWWDTTASGGEDASPPVHRGLGSSGLGLRGEAQGPANRQGGAQKLLKISRFRFQSICGARLLTLVALAFSLASAAVGLRWRPLS